MVLSSRKAALSRDQCASDSPLSPTVIHYRQKYQILKVSQDYHREVKRHHQFRNTSRQHQ